MPDSFPASWKPLREGDVPQSVWDELRSEFPCYSIIKQWLLEKYDKQSAVPIDGEMVRETQIATWLAFQLFDDEVDVLRRRHPRQENLLFETYGSKVSQLAQRRCTICHAAEYTDHLCPIHVIPIRIPPISHQAALKRRGLTQAFKVAIRTRLARSDVADLLRHDLCVALTFVLKIGRGDKDVDNMAKAMLDAVANALGFDDRRVQHLDVAKLMFRDAEEYVYLRLAPSYLKKHENVVAQVFHQGWAGQKVLDVLTFLEP